MIFVIFALTMFRHSLIANPLRILYVVPVFVLLFLVHRFWTASSEAPIRYNQAPATSGPLPFPTEYNEVIAAPDGQEDPPYCVDRFSTKYLDDARKHGIQYCSSGSSRLTCFHSQTQPNGDRDSLCVGQNAPLVLESQTFQLDCNARLPSENETEAGLIAFRQLRPYWYETGPAVIFNEFVDVRAGPPAADLNAAAETTPSDERTAPIKILVKREGHKNVWHSLMEIWSMTLTLDVLRMSREDTPTNGDGAVGAPFFSTPEDVPNTQVVLLDDNEDGPFFGLWSMFSGQAPVRLKAIMENVTTAQAFASTPNTLVIPLPGGSNPMWQNDWEDRDCRTAPTLKMFIRRILMHYQIPWAAGPRPGIPAGWGRTKERDLVLTFVDRRGTRKLIDQEAKLDALRARFPHIRVRSIDFGALSLPEQIRIAQETDILVGVHGAGLTHTMFLREGTGAVVEIQPPKLGYKGFKNMARMLGRKYFTAVAEIIPQPHRAKRDVHERDEEQQESEPRSNNEARATLARRDEWHFADIKMEKEAFVDLVSQAVLSFGRKDGEGKTSSWWWWWW